jgi:serine O-acetyltransferase
MSDDNRLRNRLKQAAGLLAMLFSFPLLLPYCLASAKTLIDADVARWSEHQKLSGPFLPRFLRLLGDKVFRTIYFHRLKCGGLSGALAGLLFSLLYRPLDTLSIYTRDIGPGLIIQHGHCSVIGARKIGANCWINQHVTIGYTNDHDCPTLGDNVRVGCGAIILGDVYVGNNVLVGANALVLTDLPSDCRVLGMPGRIVRQKGALAHE